MIGLAPLVWAGVDALALVEKFAAIIAASTLVVSTAEACCARGVARRARCAISFLVFAAAARIGETKTTALCRRCLRFAGDAAKTLPRVRPGTRSTISVTASTNSVRNLGWLGDRVLMVKAFGPRLAYKRAGVVSRTVGARRARGPASRLPQVHWCTFEKN